MHVPATIMKHARPKQARPQQAALIPVKVPAPLRHGSHGARQRYSQLPILNYRGLWKYDASKYLEVLTNHQTRASLREATMEPRQSMILLIQDEYRDEQRGLIATPDTPYGVVLQRRFAKELLRQLLQLTIIWTSYPRPRNLRTSLPRPRNYHERLLPTQAQKLNCQYFLDSMTSHACLRHCIDVHRCQCGPSVALASSFSP